MNTEYIHKLEAENRQRKLDHEAQARKFKHRQELINIAAWAATINTKGMMYLALNPNYDPS